MNVVKANVSTAVVFVIMASMANIVALMLVGLIAILMEFVKICLKRINDRNMSKFFAAESNVKKNSSRPLGFFDDIFSHLDSEQFLNCLCKNSKDRRQKKMTPFFTSHCRCQCQPGWAGEHCQIPEEMDCEDQMDNDNSEYCWA